MELVCGCLGCEERGAPTFVEIPQSEPSTSGGASIEYGQILSKRDSASRVYILGVLASEEPNFLFSYNITSLTESMRKRLSRERLNVGRGTYTDRVKSILKSSRSEKVHKTLIGQVRQRSSGQQCDEMGWAEIAQMALNLMNEASKVVYFTEDELQRSPGIADYARGDGYDIVLITDAQKGRLLSQVQDGGPTTRTIEQYIKEFNASFQYKFIAPEALTASERRIYDLTPRILNLVGAGDIPAVRVSRVLRPGLDTTKGVWDPAIPAVVIRRDALGSLSEYAGVLLHEAAHATSHAGDASRAFENVLTTYLGWTSTEALRDVFPKENPRT